MRNPERWNNKENIRDKNAKDWCYTERGKARYSNRKKNQKNNIPMKRIKKAWKGTRPTKYIRVCILKASTCSPTAKPYTFPVPAQTQSCN